MHGKTVFPYTERISNDKQRISKRFRNTNITLFVLVSFIIVSVTVALLQNITDTVSKDYARLYSTNTSGALSTHLGKEIALVKKAANSDAVINWFKDEFNEEKKAVALDEMLEIISGLYSDNMYLAIDNSLNEFTIEEFFTVDDVVPHSFLTKGYYDDEWYFECRDSANDYLLNVDIDKILHRKRVWVNYKVVSDGVPVGVICSGLEFAETAEELLAEFDASNVRGVIIDEKGVVQMDSISLGDDNFLRYEQFYNVEDEFKDPAFLSALKTHLEGINVFFESYEPIIIKLSGGQYNYATIAPIKSTNWSVITFYSSSSLFNMTKLAPLFAVIFIMLIGYALITSSISYRLLFRPIELLIHSLAAMNENKDKQIYGIGRNDEIGDLSQTIKDMKYRLDSYSSDLEKEVEVRSADLKLAYEQAKEQNQIIMSSINYASKIQRNLLPNKTVFEEVFSDYSIIWKPRDIVGGDIYWIKNFDSGTVLCVCDCTGHGTPGALLTMLVVSALETIVKPHNYHDTAEIIWQLEQNLVTVFSLKTNEHEKNSLDIKDGCDIAVLFIANDKSITISAGNTNVFVCNGKEVQRIRGQRIYVGEGRIYSKDTIKTVHISADSANKFYVASDGLFDQPSDKQPIPFGYKRFGDLILTYHNEKQSFICDKIWEAFEAYRGEKHQVDDFELITFKP